jgi:cytochrome b6-f complex iron-sulfur subunit
VKTPVERIAAFVDDLVYGRRPRRFRASPEDLETLQVAAEIRSAQPAADLPTQAFIDGLGHRLRTRMDATPRDASVSRRALFRTAGFAAAAGIAGVALDRALVGLPSSEQGTMTPTNGTWRPVATVQEVPSGQALRFSSGPVEGFVVNDGGTIKAVSAVCTHQGCLLRLDAAAHRLRCPCHASVFSTSGVLISHQLPRPPANLPNLQARVRDGQIEVLVV